MGDTSDLQKRLHRLRRLGLHQGAAHLQPPPQKRAVGVEQIVPGRVLHTPVGDCFIAEASWPLTHRHGHLPLGAALDITPQTLARLADLAGGQVFDLRRAVFFDVETSGLSGGAGTFVFQTGVGFFQGDTFCVQQYFMRDLTEETAYLHAVGEVLDRFEALVSFNGRAFDLPLLNSRFTLARQPRRLTRAPHLDLLTPARRLWRRRLDSCALGALERQVLGVQRGEAEVPGWLVPRIYLDYLQTGDATELAGVFYHNQIDVLSMVSLAARLGAVFADPLIAGPLADDDLFSLGHWYETKGMLAESEAVYRAVLDRPATAVLKADACRQLGFLLKRQERRQEAADMWRAVIADDCCDEVYAHIELAKHYEWHVGDLPAAAAVTHQAMALLAAHSSTRPIRETFEELTHRLRRLERKMAQAETEA
ncbi:MAG: ribonuclease H-like domain-containing protein [Chloroflexota bacterium]